LAQAKFRDTASYDPTVATRLPRALVGAIDAWAAKQGMTRARALRVLLETAVDDGALEGASDKPRRRLRAK